MIVVDTSVAVKWAVDEPRHAEALALLDLDEPRFAPDVLLPELTHVLRKKTLRGEITKEQAHAAVRGVTTAIDQFVPSLGIATAALALSEILDHSAYDCFFLVVAVGRGVLVTADEVFAKKCFEFGFAPFVFRLGDDLGALLAKTAILALPAEMTLDELKRLAGLVETTVDSLYEIARSSDPMRTLVSFSYVGQPSDSRADLAMRKALGEMTEEQRAAFLATAWLGRDYHNAEDWPRLVVNAKQTAREGFSVNAAYIMAQLRDLASGMEKLRRILPA